MERISRASSTALEKQSSSAVAALGRDRRPARDGGAAIAPCPAALMNSPPIGYVVPGCLVPEGGIE